MPPSPGRTAALTSELRAEVERRLAASADAHLDALERRLHASMAQPFGKPSAAALEQRGAALGTGNSGLPSSARLADVFDELMASDQARRMAAIVEEGALRDRELALARAAAEKASKDADRAARDAAAAREQRDAAQAATARAADGAAVAEQALKRLQHEHEALQQQVATDAAARAAGDRAAAAAEARASAAESLADTRAADLADLQAQYRKLISDRQKDADALRAAADAAAAERDRLKEALAARGAAAAAETSALRSELGEARGALAAAQAAAEAARVRAEEAAAAAQDAKAARKELAASVRELEGLLADSELDRRSLRSKYIGLGERVEGLVREEAAARAAAEEAAVALRTQGEAAAADAAATAASREGLVAELEAVRAAMKEMDRQQLKTAKKLDRRMGEMARELEGARQEAQERGAQVLDLEAQLLEERQAHQADSAALQAQVAALQSQFDALQADLQAAATCQAAAVEAALAAAEERVELELRSQQLTYEGRIQELELQARYLSALEVLAPPQLLPAPGEPPGSPAITAAAAALAAGAAAGGSGPAAGGGGGLSVADAFDVRLRRIVAERLGRAEAAQAWEARLQALQQDLSTECRRRLESLDAEWAARCDARVAETECSARLRLQQAELTWSMDVQRLEGRLTDAVEARGKLEQQVAALTQDLDAATRESAALRAQADELRTHNMALGARSEELVRSVAHLQGVVGDFGAAAARGDKEAIAELASKVEARTAERNEALQQAAALDARLKVFEAESSVLQQQRQAAQAAADAADAARQELQLQVQRLQGEAVQSQHQLSAAIAREAALQQALATAQQAAADAQQAAAGAQQAAAAGREAAGAAEERAEREREERQRLGARVEELIASRESLSQELARARAEVDTQLQRLQEAQSDRDALREALSSTERALHASQRDAQDLRSANEGISRSRDDLARVHGELERRAEAAAEDQWRLSMALQGAEVAKAGLQKRLSCFEGGLGTPGGGGVGGSLGGTPNRGSPVPRASPLGMQPLGSPGPGGDVAGSGGVSFVVAGGLGGGGMGGSGFGNPGSRSGSPAGGTSAGRGSMWRRSVATSLVPAAAAGGGAGGGGAGNLTDTILAANLTNIQDMEGVIASFEGERLGLIERVDALSIDNQALRQQVAASADRCAALGAELTALRQAAERREGTLVQEAHQQATYTEQVLSEAQRSRMDLQQVNAWLQTELDACRAARRQQEALTVEAQQRVVVMEARIVEVQHQAESAVEGVKDDCTAQLQRLGVAFKGELNGLRGKVALLRDEVRQRLGAVSKEWTARLAEVNTRWSQHVDSLKSAHATALASERQSHAAALSALQLELEASRAESAALREASGKLQGRLGEAGGLLLEALRGRGGEGGADEGEGDVEGALASDDAEQVIGGIEAAWGLLLDDLAAVSEDRDQLLADSAALAADLSSCATNLQALVSMLALTVPLEAEVQVGLNARDPTVFEEQLQAAHEAIVSHIASERQQIASELEAGPLAEAEQHAQALAEQLATAQQRLEAAGREREADAIAFDDSLRRCRQECAEGAEVARQESLSLLRGEVAQLKAQLQELQALHGEEVAALQESSSKQLSAHVKTADRIIRELESTASTLQVQLAAEVERADGLSAAIKRVQADQERKIAAEARKERRQTGEIETLRGRLRELEANQKEKEEEMKGLRRSLRQKELSLLTGSPAGASSAGGTLHGL